MQPSPSQPLIKSSDLIEQKKGSNLVDKSLVANMKTKLPAWYWSRYIDFLWLNRRII